MVPLAHTDGSANWEVGSVLGDLQCEPAAKRALGALTEWQASTSLACVNTYQRPVLWAAAVDLRHSGRRLKKKGFRLRTP